MFGVAVPPCGECLSGFPGSVSGDAVPIKLLVVEELRTAELTVRLVMHLHDLLAVDETPVTGYVDQLPRCRLLSEVQHADQLTRGDVVAVTPVAGVPLVISGWVVDDADSPTWPAFAGPLCEFVQPRSPGLPGGLRFTVEPSDGNPAW